MSEQLSYYRDTNFEWLATCLISEMKLDIKNIEVELNGIFNRILNHDVERIELFEDGSKKKLRFHLNREGIYDCLPEGIFHHNRNTDHFDMDMDKMKRLVEKDKEKENHARSFFKIFETELLRLNILNWKTYESIKKRNYGQARAQIISLLGFDTSLFTEKELTRILLIYPHINNKFESEFWSNLFNRIFDFKVTVSTYNNIERFSFDNPLSLGEISLGWNSCLGTEIESCIKIAEIKATLDSKLNLEQINLLKQKLTIIGNWLLPFSYHIKVKPIFKDISTKKLGLVSFLPMESL